MKIKTALLFAGAVFGGWSAQVLAYGPIQVTNDGKGQILQDYDHNASDGKYTINYYPEPVGICGSRTNAQMNEFVASVFSQIAAASLDGIKATPLVLNAMVGSTLMTNATGGFVNYDIDQSTFEDPLKGVYVYNNDSNDPLKTNNQTPIIYDNDGKITSQLFGESNKCATLGFAGPINTGSTTIEKGQMVINCAALSCMREVGGKLVSTYTDEDLKTIVLHEFLHVLELDHTQVGVEYVEPGTNDTANDAPVATMYPRLLQNDGGQQSTLNKDDIVGIAAIYPSSDFSSRFGSISGQVVDKSGKMMSCVEIVAKNIADSTDTVSTMTGYDGTLPNGGTFPKDCISKCNTFTIKGLRLNNSYVLTLRNIRSGFTGGSSIGRCDPPMEYDFNGDDGMAADPDGSNNEFESTSTSTVKVTSSTGSTPLLITTKADYVSALNSQQRASGSTSTGDGDGDGDGSGDGQEASSENKGLKFCALTKDGDRAVNPGWGGFFFVFTALVVLATGRACATVKHSSRR